MERGYVKVWRKLEDSGLLQMPNTLALFMFLLMKASRTKRKVGTNTGVVELLPGQFISGRKQLAELLEQGEQQIRTSLNRLHEMEIITSISTSKYTVYTIVNYELYQDGNQQVTSTATNSQPASQPADNQQLTTKQECINISTSLRSVDKRKKSALSLLLERDIPEQLAKDWLLIRDKKRQPLTETSLRGTIREAAAAHYSLEQAITVCCENSWAGFKAEYVLNKQQPKKAKPQFQTAADKQREQANRMFGDLTNGRGREIDVSESGAEWDRQALSHAGDDIR